MRFQLPEYCYRFRDQMEQQAEDPNLYPSAIHRPWESTPFSFSVDSKWRRLAPFFVSGLPLVSICKPSGEDTCDQRPVTWQPSQKGPHAWCTAGCWHLLPPVSSSRPPEPHTGAEKKSSLLFQLPPSSHVRETILHIKGRRRQLPVPLSIVRAKLDVYWSSRRGSCL